MWRSWLFVPGDQPARIIKAQASGADAVIMDLEDAVVAPRKAEARRHIAAALQAAAGRRPTALWVRINPLSSPLVSDDLAAIVAHQPDGIVLPKPDSGQDVRTLDGLLTDMEAKAGVPQGRIRILPIATETPRSVFALHTYAGVSARLAGLTWGAEDLPAAVGASVSRWPDGSFTDLCRMARSLCLAGAAAADVPAIEGVYPAFRDLDGLKAYAIHGRDEGFTGMMAIHPAQVAVINEVFTPSAAEIERARRIVAVFAANPNAGVQHLDGAMLDAPHLKQAQRLLSRAAPQK